MEKLAGSEGGWRIAAGVLFIAGERATTSRYKFIAGMSVIYTIV